MNTATNTFEPVHIGTTPAGVEWVAYKPEHVEPMTARFEEHLERLAQKAEPRVTVQLTMAQVRYLDGHFMPREELIEAGCEIAPGRRITGPKSVIGALALGFEELSEYLPEEEASWAETENQAAFIAASIRKCLMNAAQRCMQACVESECP